MKLNYGSTILYFRKEDGISQKEMAKELGINVTYLSALENDKKKLVPSMLNKIVEYFKIEHKVFIFKALALSQPDIEGSILTAIFEYYS